MVTIGVDPHKQTHTAAAINELGVEVAHRTVPARPAGNGQLLESIAVDAEDGCVVVAAAGSGHGSSGVSPFNPGRDRTVWSETLVRIGRFWWRGSGIERE